MRYIYRMNKIDLKHPAGYEDDFALWSAEQAALIRTGKLDKVDLENVAEEIESLGRSDKREIASRLKVLQLHLLKWQFQPKQRDGNGSWLGTIREQRGRIALLLEESPSLRRQPALVLDREYRNARLDAHDETKLALGTFPETCPYTIDQILDPDFFPTGK